MELQSIGSKLNPLEQMATAEGLTLLQLKEKIEETFYTQYGRLHSSSGKMFIDIEHNSGSSGEEFGEEGEPTKGSVKWRKGYTESGELIEDLVLERPQAIGKFFKAMERGFKHVFNAVTADDFKRESEKLALTYSSLHRTGKLGVYTKGKSFFRIDEYSTGVYSIERGYDGNTTFNNHHCSEAEALSELSFALADGFRKEGEEQVESNPLTALEAFGVSLEGNLISDAVVEEEKTKEGSFNPDIFAGVFGDE